MALFKKSRYTLDMPVENKGEEYVALYQTMTQAFVLIPERNWSYILSDPIAPAEPATIDMLCEQGFLVKDGTDETAMFENWRQQYVHDFSTLRSKVLVTRKCNNRCRYCMIDPEAKEMSHETALAMDRFYMETMEEKHPQKVEDDFLGGEPLLNAKIVLESAARRFYYCLGKGIEYGFVITTNGTLLKPSIISRMKEVGLAGIRVSLAGSALVHDALRPSKENGKTYQVIMENLEAVSGMVPISVECQYDSGAPDYLSIPDMLDDFVKRGIAVEHIAFAPILPRRGKSLYDSGMGDPRIFLYLMGEARKRGMAQDSEAPSSACIADFRAKFVFDTNGAIIPCPSVQGGEMAYGHVTTGVDFVAEAQLLRQRLAEKCLNKCSILPVCMGGCRLQAQINGKGFNGINCHYDALRLSLEDYVQQKAAAAISLSFKEDSIDLREAA